MATSIADLEIVVGAETKEAEQGLDNLNKGVDNLANNPNFDKATVGLMGIGTAGILGFTKSTFAAMDFESAVIDLGIATNTQGEELDDLKMKVLDLGAAFPYSAIEATNLMTELAKLGYSGEALDYLTESTMQLSTALGTDLVPTGEAVNAILKSFNMEASQAGEMADKLYRILAAGSLDLDSLMNAWQYLGSVVSLAGLSFEEVGGLLTILTDQMIPAERAGRALKALFDSLIDPSDELRQMFTDLGIVFEDADGKLLSVMDIIKNIWDEWQNLTEVEQIDLAKLLVGTQFWDAAVALFNSGREAFDQFMENYENAISIVDAVKMKMESAQQIWETFKETISNISIVVGEQLLPAFKSVVSWLTNIADKITTLNPGFLKIIAVGGSLGSAFTFIAGAIGMASKNMGVVTTGLRILGSTATGPVGAIMLLATAFIYAYQNSETFRNIVNAVVGVIGDMASKVGEVISVFTSFVSTNETARTAVEAMGVAVGVMLAAWAGYQVFQLAATGINLARTAMIGLNASMLANPVVLIVAAIAALAAGVYFAYKKFEPFRKIVDRAFSGLKKLGSLVGGAIVSGFKSLASAISPVVSVIGTLVGSGLSNLVSMFQSLASIVGDTIVSGFNSLTSAASSLWDIFTSIVGGGVSDAFDSIKSSVETIIEPFKSLKEAIEAAFDGDWKTMFSKLGDAASESIDAVIELFTGAPKAIIELFTGIDWDTAWDTLKTAAKAAFDGVKETATEIFDSVRDAITSIDFGALVEGGWDIINKGISLAWDAITSLDWSVFVPKLSWFTWIGGKITDVAEWVWNKIKSHFPIAKVIAGSIGNVATWVWDNIKSFFPSASKISGSISSVGTWLWDNIGKYFPQVLMIKGAISVGTWLWGKIKAHFPSASVISNLIGDFGEWLWEKIGGIFPDSMPEFSWPSPNEILEWLFGPSATIKGRAEDDNNFDVTQAQHNENLNPPTPDANGVTRTSYARYRDGTDSYNIDPASGMALNQNWFRDQGIGQYIGQMVQLKAAIAAAESSLGTYNQTQTTTGTQSAISFGQIGSSSQQNLGTLGSSIANTSTQMLNTWMPNMNLMASTTGLSSGTINTSITNNTNAARNNLAANAAAMGTSLATNMASMAGTTQTQMVATYGSVSSQMNAMNIVTNAKMLAMAAIARVQTALIASSTRSNLASANSSVTAQMVSMNTITSARMAAMAAVTSVQTALMVSTTRSQTASMTGAMAGGMANTAAQVAIGAARWSGIITSAGAGAIGSARSVGYNIGAGVAAGLWSAVGGVAAAANAIVAAVDRAIIAKARIHSPSRMFMYHGSMIGEGFALGIESAIGDVSKAGLDMANAAVHPIQTGVPQTSRHSTLTSPESGGYVINNPTYNVTVKVEKLAEYQKAADFFNDLETERQLNQSA